MLYEVYNLFMTIQNVRKKKMLQMFAHCYIVYPPIMKDNPTWPVQKSISIHYSLYSPLCSIAYEVSVCNE